MHNLFDFSIILAHLSKTTNQVFRLRRYNGKSHEHTNQIERDRFYTFHMHTATQRYQERGLKEDGFAEPTERYGDLASALDCLITDCGFVQPRRQAGPVILKLWRTTMELQAIEQDFRQSVGEKVSLLREGNERYRVFTPFLFEDGDHLSIVFKRVGRDWVLSDEGNTLMRLTYEIDLRDLLRGNRQKIIDGALNTFGVANQDGELIFVVRDDAYGDALFSFVQSLIKISDVTYLSRERAKSTFLEDFRQFMQETAPTERLEFEYHDPGHDPEGIYIVDCRVNHMARPLFAFAIPGDDRCRDVTITLHQFERWGMDFQSLAVFEDQQAISRPVLARFSDVADKQFSSLAANRERIKRYLTDTLSSTH